MRGYSVGRPHGLSLRVIRVGDLVGGSFRASYRDSYGRSVRVIHLGDLVGGSFRNSYLNARHLQLAN